MHRRAGAYPARLKPKESAVFFNDDSDAPRISMNGRQKLFILVVDAAIIAELCIGMAAASSVLPELFTVTFMKTFFAMFLPTLAIGIVGFRRLRDRAESAQP